MAEYGKTHTEEIKVKISQSLFERYKRDVRNRFGFSMGARLV